MRTDLPPSTRPSPSTFFMGQGIRAHTVWRQDLARNTRRARVQEGLRRGIFSKRESSARADYVTLRRARFGQTSPIPLAGRASGETHTLSRSLSHPHTYEIFHYIS